jgi:selenocysteine-specific elongation factor
MREIIVGTAGHIDHGKTALVEALTGINTDRLKEEKLRGITIELGFAHLKLPSGRIAAIVDVPGHERFVKTMVAGATGVDLVIMVIAADEGIMPQTREHLDICQLLRVQKGIVALTKVDLVEEEWLQLVEEDVREFIKGTFLQGAPVVRTSAHTREGLQELVEHLDSLAGQIRERPPAKFFRLPVDRSFTIKGFGTVVTGTLMAGRIREGDSVEVAPKGLQTRVRGLQVHNQPVKESVAGMRTAVNLQGVEKEEIERGDVLIPPGSLPSTHMVDAHLQYLPSAPWKLKNRARVRFHAGTAEILARVVLLDREVLEPGEEAYVQLRLESPTVVVHGDSFVIRSYSPAHTIGGGIVLDGFPSKHKRNSPQVLDHLRGLASGNPEMVSLLMVKAAGTKGLSLGDLQRRLNLADGAWEEILSSATLKGAAKEIDVPSGGGRPKQEEILLVHKEAYERVKHEILEALKEHAKARPLEAGLPKEDLRARCPSRPSPRVFSQALQELVDGGQVVLEGDKWRWSGHTVELGGEQRAKLKLMENIFQKAGLQPPSQKEVEERLGLGEKEARDMLELLVRQGKLVKVKEGMYFWPEEVKALEERLVAFLKERGEIQPLEFKEMTGLSRKYMIPLLEYFDRTKVTMRVGDKRVLRR